MPTVVAASREVRPLLTLHNITTPFPLDQGTACAVIHIQGTAIDDEATPYAFQDEVLIQRGRRVVLQGTAATLPFLDCSAAIRCFRVLVRACVRPCVSALCVFVCIP